MTTKHLIEAKLHETFGIVRERAFDNRQAYLKALLAHVNKTMADNEDEGWDDLGDDAQEWVNTATDANNSKKKSIPDFPEMDGDNGNNADDDHASEATDDDDNGDKRRRPAKKAADKTTERSNRKRDAESDDDDDKPKRRVRDDADDDDKPKRRARDSDDVDDDDKPKRRVRDDADDDDKPRRGRPKQTTKPVRKARNDDDNDDDKQKAKQSRGLRTKRGAVSIATHIKQIMLKKPAISKEDLKDALAKKNLKPSNATISSIRQDFRHSLRFLKDAGLLDGFNLKGLSESG